MSIAPIKSKSAVAPIISQAEEGSSSSSSSNSSTEELIVQKEPVQPTVPVHDEYLYDVLFHFNPRYRKGQLAMNDKQGTWGMLMNRKLGKTVSVEEILAAELEVMIQIRKEVYIHTYGRSHMHYTLYTDHHYTHYTLYTIHYTLHTYTYKYRCT